MKIFSIRLKEERQHNNYTQKQMAELLSLPTTTYQNYEALSKNNREPNLEMVVKIAKILNISADYLLGLED